MGNLPDPDRFQNTAKKLVADNYNDHRDPEEIPPLTVNDIGVVSFTVVGRSWKAFLASPVARGLIWVVTFSDPKRETSIDVYRRINNVKSTAGRRSDPESSHV